MIARYIDDARPAIFRTERIDVPESEEERERLSRRDFTNDVGDACAG